MNHQGNKNNCYDRAPIRIVDRIPIFSKQDFYIRNYKKIARDHINSLKKLGENPFIAEELWVELEASTRNLILKYVKPGAKVLDVGVGLGRLLGPLSGYERYGIDISLEYLKIAQERNINVAMAKIEDMPYCENFFDAVVITDVLEHVLDLSICCKKIINVLRPGGALIIRVPFKEDLSPYIRDDLPYEYIHLRNFDEYSLRLLFSKIYKLQFLEANTIAPFLQGTPRFKIQLLPQKTINQLREIIIDNPRLNFLSSISNLSAEEFQDQIYSLRDVDPISFSRVVDLLVNGIEINVVFKKQ